MPTLRKKKKDLKLITSFYFMIQNNKEQIKAKTIRRKEMIKVRVEINKSKNRKMRKKSTKPKVNYFITATELTDFS